MKRCGVFRERHAPLRPMLRVTPSAFFRREKRLYVGAESGTASAFPIARLLSIGSTRARSFARASSAKARASTKGTSWAEPSPNSRCFPPRTYMNVHRFRPLASIDKYKFPPSECRPGVVSAATPRAVSFVRRA